MLDEQRSRHLSHYLPDQAPHSAAMRSYCDRWISDLHRRSVWSQLGRFVGALTAPVFIVDTDSKVILRIEFKASDDNKGVDYIDHILIIARGVASGRLFSIMDGVRNYAWITNRIPR